MKKLFLAVAALALSVAGVMAVTPTLVKKTDRKACSRWVDSVYNSLSERERVAQLMCPKVVPTQGANSKAAIDRLVGKNGVGALLFTEGTIAQYADMINYAQKVAKVPVLMTFDGEWGLAMRIKGTPKFPRNMAIGAITNDKVLYEYGEEVARQMRAMGLHVNFAPVADVNSNPDNPVIGTRSFGEDAGRVARQVSAFSRGLEDGGIQAVAKHFPGHGDTNTDSHKALPTISRSRSQFNEVEFVPFRKFIDEGCSGIMTAHISVPFLDKSGTASSMSAPVYKILRDDMGFEGLIYTDALGMKGAVAPDGGNRSLAALEAGADVLECVNAPTDIDAIMAALNSGKISKKVIEDRCKRVLTYKYILGLNRCPAPVNAKDLSAYFNNAEADRVQRDLAAASMTVVRNEGDILPVRNLAHRDIAVVTLGTGGKEFTEICRRYARCEVFNAGTGALTPAQIKAINGHETVIVAVSDAKAAARTSLASLKGVKNLIVAFMISPYKVAGFADAVSGAKAIVLGYDDNPYAMAYAAQAVFGGIEVTGRTPVAIPGVAKDGAGMDLGKIRLGYASPLQKGLRASLTDSIDSLVNKALADKAMPGCQVLVAKGGDVVINKNYGVLTAGGAPVTDTTIYDLASVSKALGTLPGVMIAVDRGLMDVDAKASKYIPGLRGTDKENITVRELLYHETGIPAALNMFNLMIDTASYKGKLITGKADADHPIKIQNGAYGHKDGHLRTDVIRRQRSADFNVEAAKGIWVGKAAMDTVMQTIYNIGLRKNKNYNYSCLNFCLLMDAEQNATGTPHQQWVSENLWEPLGNTSISYRPSEKYPLSRIAPTENDTYLRRQTVHGYVHDETAAFSGGVQGNAGLFASANDLAKICQMWLNGGTYGGDRILSEKTVKMFTTEKSPTCRRGLGFDKPDVKNPDYSPTCDEANASVYGHLGFTGTVFWVDPENDMFFIFLTNRVNPTRDNAPFNRSSIRPRLFSQVYKALQPE